MENKYKNDGSEKIGDETAWLTLTPIRHITLTSELRTSSGTFLSMSQRERVAECEKMTGARVTANTSLAVLEEACERSTSSPTRFISFTNSCFSEKQNSRLRHASWYNRMHGWQWSIGGTKNSEAPLEKHTQFKDIISTVLTLTFTFKRKRGGQTMGGKKHFKRTFQIGCASKIETRVYKKEIPC